MTIDPTRWQQEAERTMADLPETRWLQDIYDAIDAHDGPELVASGGWCAPLAPMYEFTWGAADAWVEARDAELAATAEWAGDLLERATEHAAVRALIAAAPRVPANLRWT